MPSLRRRKKKEFPELNQTASSICSTVIFDGKALNPSSTASSVVKFSLLCCYLDVRAWFSMETSVVEPLVS